VDFLKHISTKKLSRKSSSSKSPQNKDTKTRKRRRTILVQETVAANECGYFL